MLLDQMLKVTINGRLAADHGSSGCRYSDREFVTITITFTMEIFARHNTAITAPKCEQLY